MKIAMTGYSATQVGSTRTPIKRDSTPRNIHERLVALDHDVTWGKFHEASSEVRDADLLILFLTPPHNLVARNAASAMLNVSLRFDRPTLVMLDDWQVKQVISGHRTVGNHTLVRINRILPSNQELLYFGDKDYQRAHVDDMTRVCRIFEDCAEWPSAWHWAAPLFKWGDPRRLLEIMPNTWPRDRFHALDVSGAVPSYAWAPPQDNLKQRRWTLASLLDRSDWLEKQGVMWPVERLGHKKSGTQVKHEEDVKTRVATNWGVLSPAYKYAVGCGWFRTRFQHAADVGSVIYADPGEVAGLLGYHVPLAEIEHASTSQLEMMAQQQAETLDTYSVTRDEFDASLTRILQEVTS